MQRSVIISGGMGDIGKAIATCFAAHDYRVCLLYHHTAQNDVDAFLHELGDGHIALQCDITDPDAVDTSIHTALTVFGSITTCIHAATSPLVRKGVMASTIEEFRAQFEVSVFGGFNLFHALIPHFVEQHAGTIVGITTTALENQSGSPMVGYLSAKAALRGLLRETHREYHTQGVRIMALAPGFVPTGLHRDLPEPVFNFLKEREPNQSTPEEIAMLLLRLCDTESEQQSGHSFSVHFGELLSTTL